MSKRIYILAIGFGLSCATGLAANAASLHLPVPASSAVMRVGTSDGAGLPGLPGGRGGEPGNVAMPGRASVAKYDIDGLYKYCVGLMDAVKRDAPRPDGDEAFMPSDCVDFFVVPSEGGTAERTGKHGESEYDDALFSYCADLLRQARRDDGLPGYKGKRRAYSNDFAPRDCSSYFDSLDKAGKGEGLYSLKRNGRRGASISGGVGGEGGKAGRGQGGGSGGAGGSGVLGGIGGRGGAGGSSD